MSDSIICPCDTSKAYLACCGRFHQGRLAPTAVALMRSRYSAFALGLDGYLAETWHASTRPAMIELDASTQWIALRIEAHTGGKPWDAEGTVSFVADFRSPEGNGQLREVSRFVFDQRWLYLDGTY